MKEKDPEAYAKLVQEQGFDKQQSWMIGNSPKSDINPSLSIGLGAVWVPHDRTWVLEQCEICVPPGARYLQVGKFSDLTQHF